MIKRRSLIRILELTPTHEYFALPGVPDEEYESLEKENAEAIKAPGAMVLGESTAKDLLKIKKRLGFSRKKRDMLYNAINGPGWALEKKDESNPTIEKEMWPLRYDISSGGFAALGLNPGGSNGVFGLKEMEAFKRFIVPRLREAKGCGMMESVKLALSYTPNKHGGGMLSDFDAEVTSDRYTARVLVKTFLREHGLSLRKVRNEDTWYIDQVLHEWVLDIFKRPVQKVAAAYFGPPLVDPRGSKTLHSIPMSQGKRAKRLRQMFEASDGVLPMIPGALVKISEKSAGDTFTRNSAGIWKRKILKDEELLEGMELEVIQVSVMKGAVGNGKRDLDVPVLAAIGSDINEVLAVVCSVFAAGSVSVKEDNPEMCRV